MRHLNLFFLFLAFNLCISCKKNDVDPLDQLPALTTNGINTFGCLVDGEVFLPKGNYAGNGLTAQSQERTWLWIGVSNSHSKKAMKLILRDDRGIGEKTYLLGKIPNGSAMYMDYSLNEVCDYDAEELIDGHVKVIKFSREKKIISGTFEFRAYDKECADTIKVTSGRFDIGGVIL